MRCSARSRGPTLFANCVNAGDAVPSGLPWCHDEVLGLRALAGISRPRRSFFTRPRETGRGGLERCALTGLKQYKRRGVRGAVPAVLPDRGDPAASAAGRRPALFSRQAAASCSSFLSFSLLSGATCWARPLAAGKVPGGAAPSAGRGRPRVCLRGPPAAFDCPSCSSSGPRFGGQFGVATKAGLPGGQAGSPDTPETLMTSEKASV